MLRYRIGTSDQEAIFQAKTMTTHQTIHQLVVCLILACSSIYLPIYPSVCPFVHPSGWLLVRSSREKPASQPVSGREYFSSRGRFRSPVCFVRKLSALDERCPELDNLPESASGYYDCCRCSCCPRQPNSLFDE